MSVADPLSETPRRPLEEIVQPFVDLLHAPRAMWGINVGNLLEGMVYFGMLNYMVEYFIQYVGLADPQATPMVGVLTYGITLAMLFFGGLADKWGVRPAIIAAFALMLVGRIGMAAAPYLGLQAAAPYLRLPPAGTWSPIHLMTMASILFVVVGYGMYQPASYSGIKQITTPKTAAMGYAMYYAVMNLGGFLPTFFSPIRRALEIKGTYWIYAAITGLSLVLTIVILSKRTLAQAAAAAKAATEDSGKGAAAASPGSPAASAERTAAMPSGGHEPLHVPVHMWCVLVVIMACLAYAPHYWGFGASWTIAVCTAAALALAALFLPPWRVAVLRWIARHPLADSKFFFFIFCLIPVQTLFAHNWLTLPEYLPRAFRGTWLGDNYEVALNLNPALIFVFVPIVTAFTGKRNVYHMMILGTFVMSAPTFLLACGPNPYLLFLALVIMTVGEALWQPRFLQYAAEIAPPGRTGAYMGVAQFPWFLTKMITGLYAGWFLARYCPDKGPQDTRTMWLIYALIAVSSTVMLVLAKPWAGKDFKTKA